MGLGESSCWWRCFSLRTCEVMAELPGPAAPSASLPPLGILPFVPASFPSAPGILLSAPASLSLPCHPSRCPGHLSAVTAPGCRRSAPPGTARLRPAQEAAEGCPGCPLELGVLRSCRHCFFLLSVVPGQGCGCRQRCRCPGFRER